MYFNARYYSSELGRFISRDPIGIADDVNLYVYVGNNPLKWVDPSGMLKKFINNIIVNIEKGGTITKDKVYDIGTITALNIIMKGGYLTEYNYFDNDYGVSAKMLDTFMNGDGTEQNYGSNDLIYKKVMNTSIYKRQVNLAINNLKSLDVTIINSYYKPGSQSLGSGLEDLNLAIGKANRKVSGFVNEKGQIETTFSVEDRYDFDKGNYLNPLTGTLNAMGLRYQERINGKPYYWNLTIKEVH